MSSITRTRSQGVSVPISSRMALAIVVLPAPVPPTIRMFLRVENRPLNDLEVIQSLHCWQ